MIITKNQLQVKRSEWECYIDTPDSVIESINNEILEILGTTTSPVLAQKRIYRFLYDNHREWGFSDSECNETTTNIINVYYNSNIDRWASVTL